MARGIRNEKKIGQPNHSNAKDDECFLLQTHTRTHARRNTRITHTQREIHTPQTFICKITSFASLF